jgi:hypothetical protein
MHTKFWSACLKGGNRTDDLTVDGKITLEWILVMQIGKVWTECIRLKIDTSGGLL